MIRVTFGAIAFLLSTGTVLASNACATRAVVASADVAVSDGSSFGTVAYYYDRDTSAIRHRYATDRLIVVEGPVAWTQADGESLPGNDFHRLFALGHQYHALLLDFDVIVAADSLRSTDTTFAGRKYSARRGSYPYGGSVYLIDGDDKDRPVGLLFEFADVGRIEVAFSDWRRAGERILPYRAEIDDGDRQFDYRYTAIEIEERSPLWFHDAVGTPDLDDVQIYRLHRELLAAHCLGDADLMADRSVDRVVSANRGRLTTISNDATRTRFRGLFAAVDYTEYHDLVPPMIDVAASGDLGWIGVNVRAVGTDVATKSPFDTQWAWMMQVRKVDGTWKHAGNASNMAEPRR